MVELSKVPVTLRWEPPLNHIGLLNLLLDTLVNLFFINSVSPFQSLIQVPSGMVPLHIIIWVIFILPSNMGVLVFPKVHIIFLYMVFLELRACAWFPI